MARFMVGVKNQRVIAYLANVQGAGCITPKPDDCCSGSGSGSGSGCGVECVYTCDQCPDGISGGWSFPDPYSADSADTITVCYVENPTDGNNCQWVSSDLTWKLSYESASGAWVLDNLDTAELWAIAGSLWECNAPNTLTSADGNPDITVSPVSDCGSGVTVPCCPDDAMSQNGTVVFGNDGTGDFACLNGKSVGITWDEPNSRWFVHGTGTSPIDWQPLISPCPWTSIGVQCVGGSWVMGMGNFAATTGNITASSADCAAHTFTFPMTDPNGYWTGSITATVTL